MYLAVQKDADKIAGIDSASFCARAVFPVSDSPSGAIMK